MDESDDALDIELTPELLLGAYASGVFPMAEGRHAQGLGWYDPERRGILPLDALHIPARLRRSLRAQIYDVTFNRDFETVIRACADARAETWINDDIIALYTETHRRGFAHSVEVRDKQTGTIVGGLYGIALGAAFFGESMFSRARDASKIGFAHLAARLRAKGFVLWDAQFVNPHLLQFGCIEISRGEYHRRLRAALDKTDVRFMARGAGRYSLAGVSVGDASGFAAASSDGASSDEYSSDFAALTDFLQSITQTS
jgi:leucyl/phenylalanyl-tRNA--protein transferase